MPDNALLSLAHIVCLLTASAGCISTVPQKPDMAKPEVESGVADFSALFKNNVSRSIYPMRLAHAPTKELMSQVLLSPNLVFESSRSSVGESSTFGPQGAIAPSPDLSNLLGKPVAISLSSVLLEYLASKGSVLIMPVITGKWQSSLGCLKGKTDCVQRGTWVERLMLKPATTQQGPLHAGVEAAEVGPSVAFAVRELGITIVDVPVVAKSQDGRISFRPRRYLGEKSVCGDLTLSVPVVVFTAEIVSTQEGRLLARIDERRSPEVDVAQDAKIDFATWKPIEYMGYTQFRNKEPIPSSEYTYVRKWRKRDVQCRRSVEAFDEIQTRVEAAMVMQLPATVAEMLTDSLNELYQSGGAAVQ